MILFEKRHLDSTSFFEKVHDALDQVDIFEMIFNL